MTEEIEEIRIVPNEPTESKKRAFRIASIAGTPYDPSGDGGLATLASIGLSGDAFRDGNLYLTDGSRIRKVSPSGIITTVVGLTDPVVHQPIPGFSGDGRAALGAQIRGAQSLDFDSAGNLYIADAGNNCIRKVTARVAGGVAQPFDGTEIISTVAGTPTVAGNSDGTGTALGALLNLPRSIAIDPAGAIYIADQANNNIRKVDAAGSITTIAGTGVGGTAVDGPAASAVFNLPIGITVDPATGDVYVADVLNSRVRKIAAGFVSTVAGTGVSSALGGLNDGGAATDANVHPAKVRFVGGVLYLLDSGVGIVRKIDAAGTIRTIAGIGAGSYAGAFPPLGDGGTALDAKMGAGTGGVQDIVFDDTGGLFITDASTSRVRFVAGATSTVFGQTIAAGNIGTIAGPPGITTFSGDRGPSALARLFVPGSLAFDPHGNLYFTDAGNYRVRKLDRARTIKTVAGNGTAGFPKDPGSPKAVPIQPGGLALRQGRLYMTNNGSRVLEDSGDLLAILCNSSGSSTPPSADGTAAEQAVMGASAVTFDTAGNLYVGDTLNNRIWKVDTTGVVKTVAGSGSVILDGVTVSSALATQMRLFGPGSIAFDANGNLYTTDGSKDRILKVAARSYQHPLDGTETVTIFAGTGTFGFSGEGTPAIAAELNGPGGLVCDKEGGLYFSDGANFRIRKVDRHGLITTIAGTGVAGFAGDGGPAVAAQIRGGPLAFDSLGNLYLSDSVNNVIRILDDAPPVISGMPGPNCSLWPPNGKMVHVAHVTAEDTGSGLAPGSFTITGTSNEPPDASQISITPDGSGGYNIALQAAREGKKTRLYSLTATARDLAGNSTTVTAHCAVRG